jgi:hypothetical protein
MKYFAVFVLFGCLVFPCFSQSVNAQRFRNLGDSMGKNLSASNSNLQYYDEVISDTGDTKTYTDYYRKFEIVAKALNESESRLDLLIRSNDRPERIKEERDFYERLIKQMDALKAEYDSWLRTVQ